MLFEVTDRLTDAQVGELCALYQNEWWTQERELSDVRRMLDHTDVVVALRETSTGKLAAFARVLTDGVYKALIFDVIVAACYRGQGLGAILMKAIVEHPRLQGVRHLELYCLPELVPFYQKWGFTAELGQLRFMRRAKQEQAEGKQAADKQAEVSLKGKD